MHVDSFRKLSLATATAPVMAMATAMAVALGLLAAGTAEAQNASGGEAPEIEATPLADHLYLLTGGGANSSVLVGEEGVLLVDSKIDQASAEAAVRVVHELGEGRLHILVNTHEHPDHTGGNEFLGSHGALIIAHEGVRSVLAAGQRGGPPAPAEALPAVTFGDNERLVLHLDGETIEIMHMPAAHTASNSLVHFVNADVYHLGDLYTRVRYPVIAGGTLYGFIDAIGQVLARSDADAKFVPGVGEVGDRADLVSFRHMLETVGDRVAALVKQGKSLEEVTAAKPTAEFDATYGDPGRLFLPVIYRQLAGAE